MSGRDVAKRLIERALRAWRGQPRRMAGRGLILAYHNVVPTGQPPVGDLPLHLPFDRFTRQLDLLARYCDLVSLPEVLQPRPSERPRIAITFDDAYHGALSLAIPELAGRRMPVTVFVTPGCFGTPGFWWDQLATSEGLPPALRSAALERHAGRQDLIAPPQPPLPASHGCATEGMLRDAAVDGVTYGAHTWTHPNLARLDAAILTEELVRPLRWLEHSGLPMLCYLAYPYGCSSPEVAAAAQSAAYEGAVLVEGGWLGPQLDRFAIPRFNVPAGLSEDGFLLRLSGVLAP